MVIRGLNIPENVLNKEYFPSNRVIDVLPDIFPITYNNSSMELEMSSYFIGKIKIEGKGKVEIQYPYKECSNSGIITLKNINFLKIPFILVNVKGNFKGWYDTDSNLLSEERQLLLTSDIYEDISVFVAKFE